MKNNIIPIEISARHIHLSRFTLDKLFGKGYSLKNIKPLSQTGEFAADETVDVKHKNKIIKNVRVVGPVRSESQLEITKTDARSLRLKTPVKQSGDLKDVPVVVVIRGNKKAQTKVIVAMRHLHVNQEEAKALKIKNNKKVSILIESKDRSTTYHDFVVRVKAGYNLSAHLDTDEANAAGLDVCAIGKLVK